MTIPNSVTNIEDWAFCDCTGLTSVTIPGNVVSIRCSAFGGCVSLSAITVDAANTAYSSADGVLLQGPNDPCSVFGRTPRDELHHPGQRDKYRGRRF